MQARRSDAGVHTFGPYAVSGRERVLRYRGEPVAIAAKAVELLLMLCERPDEVVSKEAIMERLWPDTFVEDGNLTQYVYLLRKLFKEHASGIAIENVPKRGYRLVVPREPVLSRSRKWIGPAIGACAAALIIAGLVLVAAAPRSAESGTLAGVALQEYMLGQAYQSDGTPEKLGRSTQLFESVVRAQPSSPLGYAGLAVSEASLAYYTKGDAQRIRLQADAITQAREAVSKNPRSADAQAALGGVELSIMHDALSAEPHLRTAIALNPNQFNALAWYGSLLMDRGRIREARRVFARAVAISPNSAGTLASLAWCDFVAGDFDDAIALSGQQLRANREAAFARMTLANAYLQKRSFFAARRQIAELSNLRAFPVQTAALHAQLDARSGRRMDAEKRLRALDARADPRQIDSWDAASIAAAYVALNDRARAFLWLTRVEPWQRGQVYRDPRFARLVADPQFTVWERS